MDTSKLADELSGRVRETLGEAESKAREIVAAAEAEAKSIRERAEAEAKSIRGRAESEGAQQLVQVREALSSIEDRLRSRPGAEVNPPAEPPVEPMPPVIPEPTPPAEPEPMPPAEPEPMPPEPEIEPPAPPQPDRDAPKMASANGSSVERSADATGARIVATKMALGGSSREEIAVYLDENYEIDGADALLEGVLAKAKR